MKKKNLSRSFSLYPRVCTLVLFIGCVVIQGFPLVQVLQRKLDALEEFRLNKERLEEEARERAAEIDRLKKEKEEVVYNLEKKAVLDRDR